MAQRRSNTEVLEDHLQRAMTGDIEGDLRDNYAEDLVFIEPSGVFHGREEIPAAAELLERAIPNARFEYVIRIVEGDVGYLVWRAENENRRVDDGTDTYVFRNGRIIAQTAYYTVKPRDA
jgi:hypothetical protein